MLATKVFNLTGGREPEAVLDQLPEPSWVRRSFGERVFAEGRGLWRGGFVESVTIGSDAVEGNVRDQGLHRAVWHLQGGTFLLECTCRLFAYCPHQVAVYLAAHGDADSLPDRPPSPAPDACPPEEQPHVAEQPPRRKAAEPHFRISLTESALELAAELRSLAGDRRWALDLDGDSSPNGFSCHPEILRETTEAIRKAGFRPFGETTGRFRLEGPGAIEGFFETTAPRWRAEGWRIELDPALRSLLEGRRQVQSEVVIQPSDSGGDRFDLTWSLTADGRPLSPKDIRALRLFPGRFFRLDDGRMVSVQRGDLRARIDELVQIGYAPLQPGPQPIKMHFLARAAALAGDSNPQHVRLSAGLAELRGKLADFSGIREVEPPPGLSGVLREYQKEGLNFLNFLSEYGFGGVLADDMGLGKTVQTLALLELERLRSGPAPSLVVCPTSVAPNWIEECSRFTPSLRAVNIRDSRQLQSCDFRNWDLVVASYGLAQKNPLDFRFRYLILDEAQQIKNPQAKRTRSIKLISAHRRLALTGTPIENSLAEVWSLFDFLMPGFLGGQTHFERRYRRPLERRPDDERTMADLVAKIRPFILRRLKSQVARELPPKSEQTIHCEMTPRQRRLYREVAAAVRGQVLQDIQLYGWEKSRLHVLAALTRLRQACLHPALLGAEYAGLGSGKLEVFLDMAESLVAAGGRVVVFSQFVGMLKILAGALRKRNLGWLYLDGASRDRQQLVRRFQQDREQPVFLMSLKAGGTGINLTAADYVILFDPWWNPAVENQAIDRVHRIGQQRPVTAYRLVASGTIEEKMELMKQRKQDMADRLLEGHGDFRSLTREDLERLLGEGS